MTLDKGNTIRYIRSKRVLSTNSRYYISFYKFDPPHVNAKYQEASLHQQISHRLGCAHSI